VRRSKRCVIGPGGYASCRVSNQLVFVGFCGSHEPGCNRYICMTLPYCEVDQCIVFSYQRTHEHNMTCRFQVVT
jgi:hypothetical protein